MKDTVLKESYVERFAREQKEKKGIPVRAESSETGIPVKGGSPTTKGSPVTEGNPAEKNILGKNAESGVAEGKQQKEGKKYGTNARSEGQATPAE